MIPIKVVWVRNGTFQKQNSNILGIVYIMLILFPEFLYFCNDKASPKSWPRIHFSHLCPIREG